MNAHESERASVSDNAPLASEERTYTLLRNVCALRGNSAAKPFGGFSAARASPLPIRPGRRGAVPLYHIHAKVLSRSAGHSAVAAAAYRSASRLWDERAHEWRDYDRRGDSVREAHVELPDGAPERFRDRETLWNEVERCEKRRDAQLCREVEFALPRELGRDAQRELARAYVREQFVERGMAADWAIHEGRGENPHCHVMLAMREMTPGGFSAKKNREWNSRDLVDEWRQAYERDQNRALEREYERQRTPEHEREYVDRRSYEERGMDREPQLHMGKDARHAERREQRRCEREGRRYEPVTDRGRENLEREERNRMRERIQERLREISDELRQRCGRVVERARSLVAEREREVLRGRENGQARGAECRNKTRGQERGSERWHARRGEPERLSQRECREPDVQQERERERGSASERIAAIRERLERMCRQRGVEVRTPGELRDMQRAIERAEERGLDFRRDGTLEERYRSAERAMERADNQIERNYDPGRYGGYERGHGRGDDYGRGR